MRLLRLKGYVYGGQGLFLGPGGQVMFGDHQPAYVGAMFLLRSPEAGSMRRWMRGAARAPRVRAIKGHLLAPVAPNWIYGHFLLETAPKIALLHATCPPDWPLLLPLLDGHWLPRMAAQLAPGARWSAATASSPPTS